MAISGRKPVPVFLSPTETSIIATLPGGRDLLDKLPGSSPDKQQSLISEARIALDAVARGESVIALGSVPLHESAGRPASGPLVAGEER